MAANTNRQKLPAVSRAIDQRFLSNAKLMMDANASTNPARSHNFWLTVYPYRER